MSTENENNPFEKGEGNFGLPEGYFQRSAASIANKIEWNEEHKAFPKLFSLKTGHGFVTPENYFQSSESQLELVLYPKLAALDKVNIFAVPEDYFETLDLKKSKDTEEEGANELVGLTALSSIKKQNCFVVDEDYFTVNQARLQTLLKEEKSAKVFNLFSIKFSYMAAAALLILALGTWTYNYYFRTVEAQDCGTLACIDKYDLVKTKNLESMDDEELYELVDPRNLEKKINEKNAGEQLKNNTDSSLNDLSTEDLLDEL